MAVRTMTHPTYGSREVEDRQVESYLNTGWSEGPEVVPEVVDQSMRAVLDEVGDDPVKAREALVAEQSRTSPRQTLVTALLRVTEPAAQTTEA